MTKQAGLLLVALLALAGLACGCGSTTHGDDDTTGGDGGLDSGSDTDTDSDADGGPDGGNGTDTSGDGCTEAAKSIYVIDHPGNLYRFWPPDKKFVKIGTPQCPGAGQAYSMSVARDGTAYVLFYNGTTCQGLYKVSTEDASCLGKTAFKCNDQGFGLFGMGFSTNGASTTDETLFVGKTSAPYKLGTIDLSTFAVSPIGTISGAPEMTGTGAGELWAFFAWTSPPHVAQFDKTTAAESNVQKFPQLASNAAFAFAHWGGDYYLFHAPSGDTTVWKLSGGQLTKYMPTTGVEIVGAGVSTCAPLTPE
jgi:hypothetical protein